MGVFLRMHLRSDAFETQEAFDGVGDVTAEFVDHICGCLFNVLGLAVRKPTKIGQVEVRRGRRWRESKALVPQRPTVRPVTSLPPSIELTQRQYTS
jgi:hypothetical protein